MVDANQGAQFRYNLVSIMKSLDDTGCLKHGNEELEAIFERPRRRFAEFEDRLKGTTHAMDFIIANADYEFSSMSDPKLDIDCSKQSRLALENQLFDRADGIVNEIERLERLAKLELESGA